MGEHPPMVEGEALSQRLSQITHGQVPVLLPLQVRLTPERGTVIWLDAFRRWRGVVSFEIHLLRETWEPGFFFDDDGDDRHREIHLEEIGAGRIEPIDVIATVDGRELRASLGELAWRGVGAWDGYAEHDYEIPVPDDVAELRIRLECEALPLHRIIELDCDVLRAALDDVWVLDPPD